MPDDTPCDFLAYLEWRLGQDADSTARLLVEWLAAYEPVSPGLRGRNAVAPTASTDEPTEGSWCERSEGLRSTEGSGPHVADLRSRFGHGDAHRLSAAFDV